MMDMKAPVSLSVSRAPKADTSLKAEQRSQSESDDFDRHLSRQIDQSESSHKPVKSNKEDKNQIDTKDTGQNLSADLDTVEPVDSKVIIVDEAPAIDNFMLETGVNIEGVIAVEPTDPVLGKVLPEEQLKAQVMPLAGNTLPREMVFENSINKDQPVQIEGKERPSQLSSNTTKQPGLAAVLLEDAEVKTKTSDIEFKPELKNQQTNNNQPARPGLNIASMMAAASAQQHVPQPTALASMNMQPNVFTEVVTQPSVMSGGITTTVQSSAWSHGLTEKVAWMVQGNMQSAELKLNPAHLGPLEVKLSIQDDKASVTFVTAHGQVKDAIDSALPRLREMLEQQGISLADVDVSQYSDQQKEQADNSEQNDVAAAMQSDAEQHASIVNESVINLDVDQGLSIFV